jgi:hypothetical protein
MMGSEKTNDELFINKGCEGTESCGLCDTKFGDLNTGPNLGVTLVGNNPDVHDRVRFVW